jgi:hypothetical protein
MDYRRDGDRPVGDEARERRIKQLILAAVTRCSSCHRRYDLDDFAIIGHREHLWMLTVICEGCYNQGFITAVLDGQDGGRVHDRGEAAPPALTDRRGRRSDLLPGERARFAGAAPVSTGDLLDLHDFLDDFDGDFADLFAGRG